MKTNEWAKTLLYVYKYLDRVAEGIDKLVCQNALNSFYTRGEKMGSNGVVATANRIIDLSARKTRLINVKVLTNKALKNLDKQYAQILIERYMDNDESEVIAQRHNLNIRTYFRKLYQAEISFCQFFARNGFGEDKLKEYLSCEKWILEIYEKFKSEREEELPQAV